MGLKRGICPACLQVVAWSSDDTTIVRHAGRMNMSGYVRRPDCPASGLAWAEAVNTLTPIGPGDTL